MILELKDLHALTSLIPADKMKTSLLKHVNVLGINLVTVTMTFLNHIDIPVQGTSLGPLSVRLENGLSQTKTHGATHILLVKLRHVNDDMSLRLSVELFGRGVGKATEIARVLDGSNLETKADLILVSKKKKTARGRDNVHQGKGHHFHEPTW